MVENVTQSKNGITINVNTSLKDQQNILYARKIMPGILESWNPRICACECDKDCEIGEYLKYCQKKMIKIALALKVKLIG